MTNCFEDLQFVEDPDGIPIKRARATYGAYELSVILEEPKTLYEAAILLEGHFVQLPGIHQKENDIIPGLTPENVTGIMRKLQSITGLNT